MLSLTGSSGHMTFFYYRLYVPIIFPSTAFTFPLYYGDVPIGIIDHFHKFLFLFLLLTLFIEVFFLFFLFGICLDTQDFWTQSEDLVEIDYFLWFPFGYLSLGGRNSYFFTCFSLRLGFFSQLFYYPFRGDLSAWNLHRLFRLLLRDSFRLFSANLFHLLSFYL